MEIVCCQSCGGSGRIPWAVTGGRCKGCAGTGRVLRTTYAEAWWEGPMGVEGFWGGGCVEVVTCPDCRGEGTLALLTSAERCRRCAGAGSIARTVAADDPDRSAILAPSLAEIAEAEGEAMD